MKTCISNKTIPLYAVIILILLGTTVSYAEAASDDAENKKRIEQLRKGVVKISALKENDVKETGAGIMLGEQEGNIYFLTAYHVIEDAYKILVEVYGNRGKQYEADVFNQRYDPANDIALLVVPSYQIKNYVEQLYEIDPSSLKPGTDTIIIGHPGDKEWELIWTKLHSSSATRLILGQGVINPAHSGGPLLDPNGNLIGIIIGTNTKDYGEVVRIDTALAVLDSWGASPRTKLRVDFCAIINRIIQSSLENYSDLKGVNYKYNIHNYWELNDKWIDITGRDRSVLVSDYRVGEKTVIYVANFGKQHDEQEAKRVWYQIADAVAECIPDEKVYKKGKTCLQVSYRAKWNRDPIIFLIHYTGFDEVELYMYRSYNYDPKSGTQDFCNLLEDWIVRGSSWFDSRRRNR